MRNFEWEKIQKMTNGCVMSDFKSNKYTTWKQVPKKWADVRNTTNKKSEKEKKMEKERYQELKYENFMNNYLPIDVRNSNSPHLIINRQFYQIEQNCIVLKCAKTLGENNQREISYEIEIIGTKNVRRFGIS